MELGRIVPDQKNIVNRVGTVIIRVDIRDPVSSSRRCHTCGQTVLAQVV